MGAFKRIAAVLVAGGAVTALACVDMSAPKGPASISLLQLPAQYVVLGDTMRDTNGVVGSPSIVSFDAAGMASTATGAEFFTTDSQPVATFNSAGQLVGNTVGQVHVIGQIGKLQTPSVAVTVIPSPPDSLTSTLPDTVALFFPPSADSALSVGSLQLAITVKAQDQSLVPGVIVTYTLSPHSSVQKYAALYLSDGTTNAQSLIDTTKVGGTSNRTLFVIGAALAPEVRLGAADTAVVTVTAKYKGAPLKNSPLPLKIPIKPSSAP
jgi:hypothetical protein